MNSAPESPAPDVRFTGPPAAIAEVMDTVMGRAADAIGALLNRPVRIDLLVVEPVTAPALTTLFRENLDNAW